MEDDKKEEPINNIHPEYIKKKILSKIVNRSVHCSKATINFTTLVLEALMSADKEKLRELTEKGLPDDLPEMRSLIWKINFDYLPYDTKQWGTFLTSKRTAYKKYRTHVFEKLEKELELYKDYDKMSEEEKKDVDKKSHKLVLEEICKDTNRTHSEMNFFVKPIDNKNTFTEKEILELKKQGLTLRQIGERLGFSQKQVHNFISRYNEKQRKLAAGIVLRRKGRPSKNDKYTETDKVNELKYIIARKDAKIKALEMENELMRDFLSLTERK